MREHPGSRPPLSSRRKAAAPLLLLTLLGACSGARPDHHTPPLPGLRETAAPARIRTLQGPVSAGPGSRAVGAPGDFLIENGRVVLVVAGLAGSLPGALLSARQAGGGNALRALLPLVGTELRSPHFQRAEIEHLGGAASLRLIGNDPAAPSVRVSVELGLHPGSNRLRLITTVQNQGPRALQQYQIADQLDWGSAEPFAPGPGGAPAGRPLLDWLGAWSAEAAYLYFRGTAVAADFTGASTRVVLETLELAPRRQASSSRQLAIGAGGQLAGLLPALFASQGIPTGTLELSVVGEEGNPVSGALVEVEQGGRALALARADENGMVQLELPGGSYGLRARAPDRRGPLQRVSLATRSTQAVRLPAGPPSRLIFEVRDQAGGLLPARLVLLGLQGTPTPWLGPAHAPAARNHLLSPGGQGSLPLPPGRYRVLVTRGPEYSLEREDLELRPHLGASLGVRLKRVVDSSDYLAVDLGATTLASPGSAVAPEVRLLASSLEGLGAVALTDQQPTAPPRLSGLLVIPGLAGESARLGRFSRLAPEPLPDLDLEAPESFWQLEEARQPAGLLTRTGFDPARADPDLVPAGIHGLRLLDADHPQHFDQLLEDWLALLRCGRRLVATAASGSRSIHGATAGYPRTLLELPAGTRPSPRGLLTALREGRAVISSGPFLRVEANGVRPGGTVRLAPASRRRRAAPGQLELHLVVSAPAWIGLDEVRVLLDGKLQGTPIPVAGRTDGVRLDQRLTVPIRGDGFLVVLVRGSSPLDPAVESPGPLRPLALSNPVWVDGDGDGQVNLRCTAAASAPPPKQRE